ncbi:hypothetical protein [Pseudoponticoccus marisrubri]|uniref:Uncharacterized protein n=1 Tax=Pseudoponticoccus marisrubri TaxID=1685382 RepID=A0A0W7WN80_9RHOB|nr:hypothetical protein [Pseudoponticoccus marisrubri]KUF12050.1 hypothetical protein AVJ23_05610 [Pseudoponticoccus marisrubri]
MTMATQTKTEQSTKPGRRAARLAEAQTLNLSVEPKVRARLHELAAAEGLELGHYVQKVLESHVLDRAAEGDELAERLSAKRAVIDHVVTLARELDGKGKFDADFILTVMKAASAEKAFLDLYQTAIGGEGKEAARAQKPLNQQLGRLIRKAVGAKGKRNAQGKVMRAQTSGEIISSYTLLTKDA